jgi:large subunit ribosomal protein L2
VFELGKRILVQRKGRGSPAFRSLSHRRRGKARYLPLKEKERKDKVEFTIIDFIHERGGVHVGQKLIQGLNAALEVGNVLPAHKIPEGTWICNVEMRPGDGGTLCRASGTHAQIRGHSKEGPSIQLPSRHTKTIHQDARAMIGIIAAGGRPDRPFLKAGLKRAFMRAKGHKSFPVVRGAAMNAASHPHGGGAHQGPGKPTTVSRNAPPGRKVGLIAARRTGLKRGRDR